MKKQENTQRDSGSGRMFALAYGLFLGLTLLKFGNPPIMEKHVTMPENIYDWVMGFPWPIAIAYTLLVLVGLLGLRVAKKAGKLAWPVWLPLAWIACILLSALQTVDASLTAPTVRHFAACAACFYLGFFCLSRLKDLGRFWGALLGAFLLVIVVGWEQHFGGLEATRKFFYLYIYPTMKEVPAEYLKKISSDRIFSTLFYPNTLAGAILLLLPPVLAFVWRLGGQGSMTPAARTFLVGMVAAGALGCLYWSGSKGGWLLLLGMVLVTLLHMPVSTRLKTGLLVAVVAVGLAGFFWKYAGFFQKGATSVVARFDYWRAAAQTAVTHPVFGTGPGTFAIPYAAIKRPEAEMTRLVHNDYLQQAADSGLLTFLVYAILIVGSLILIWRRTRRLDWNFESNDWFSFAVWLGVAGWAAQSLIDFGLYIPALAWPAFTFLGCLLGWQRVVTEQPPNRPELSNAMDKARTGR